MTFPISVCPSRKVSVRRNKNGSKNQVAGMYLLDHVCCLAL